MFVAPWNQIYQSRIMGLYCKVYQCLLSGDSSFSEVSSLAGGFYQENPSSIKSTLSYGLMLSTKILGLYYEVSCIRCVQLYISSVRISIASLFLLEKQTMSGSSPRVQYKPFVSMMIFTHCSWEEDA